MFTYHVFVVLLPIVSVAVPVTGILAPSPVT
jgi:hypothetical protein